MPTFSELYSTRLTQELGTDDASRLFTTARRKAAINAGLLQFADLTECTLRQSTVAATQSFSLQTAAHSSGPWVTEGSTSVPGTATVTGAAVLRLVGPYAFVRPYINSASTGNYTFRLIAAR